MVRDLYRFDKPGPLRVSFCIVLFVLVLASGTFGYYWIEGWSLVECLYMTVITVSTVGYGEVHSLSHEGYIFTVFLIFFGVTSVALSLSVLFEYFIQRGLTNLFGRNKMDKQIAKLSGHIIICGYGRTGFYIARDLQKSKKRFLVIENDPERINILEQEGFLYLQADASDEDILETAGIDRAEALVASLAKDADNLYLTLSARSLSSTLRIIARAVDPDSGHKFIRAGASQVVSPFSAGANRIVQLLTRPAAVDLIELVGGGENISLEVREIAVAEDSQMAHKTLAEAHVRQVLGGMVFAIKRPNGKTLFDPVSETRLEPGDVLVVLHKPQNVDF